VVVVVVAVYAGWARKVATCCACKGKPGGQGGRSMLFAGEGLREGLEVMWCNEAGGA
jgi:hypothetical protein